MNENIDRKYYPQKCKIIYDGPISTVFDETMERIMKHLDYHRWASGMSCEGKRDISFEQIQ